MKANITLTSTSTGVSFVFAVETSYGKPIKVLSVKGALGLPCDYVVACKSLGKTDREVKAALAKTAAPVRKAENELLNAAVDTMLEGIAPGWKALMKSMDPALAEGLASRG